MQVKTVIAALAFAAASAASFAQAPVAKAVNAAPAAPAASVHASTVPAKHIHHVAAKKVLKHPLHKVAHVAPARSSPLTKAAHHPAAATHLHHTSHVVHAHKIVHHV